MTCATPATPLKSPKPMTGKARTSCVSLTSPRRMRIAAIILDVVARTAEQVFMPLTVGGGINKTEDIRALLKAGADKVSINTGAVNRPEFVREAAQMFGSQCIVVAIDAKQAGNRWEVFTHGGRNPTGIDACDWAERMEHYGAGEILLTSMDRDGTKAGYDLALTRMISERVSIRLSPRAASAISNTSTKD